ncbi:MAG: alpha/beta fold hydrolase [Victivallales bacterium]|nr:alpha/beta fold hydrolase [Victivallales bacterium]
MSELTSEAIVSAGVREKAISFSVEGQSVNGIIASPENGTPKGAIVFSHGWSGFRSGPADLLTYLARTFAANGYASLRFDYRGRGESGGDGLAASLVTMADDLVGAVAAIKEETGFDKPILCGLCSGGNVVVGTLKRIPQAKALLLMSVYPFSDGDAFGRDIHRTFHYLAVYWQKLWRKDTWSRFFKGDVSLKSVCNVIFGHFLKRGANKKKEEGAAAAQPAEEGKTKLPKAAKAAAVESRSQDKEPPKKHLANLRPDLPAIMLYGLADPDASAAIKYFGDYINENKLPIQMHTIEGANHNFSSREWRNIIEERMLSFLSTL